MQQQDGERGSARGEGPLGKGAGEAMGSPGWSDCMGPAGGHHTRPHLSLRTAHRRRAAAYGLGEGGGGSRWREGAFNLEIST